LVTLKLRLQNEVIMSKVLFIIKKYGQVTQLANWRVYLAAKQFRSQRADYYDYLAEMIAMTSGAKTLLSMFEDDARRYQGLGARGVLSRHWTKQFPKSGGDLFTTWFGSLPTEDLVAVQAAQYAGSGALTQTLRQLAAVVRTTDAASQAFIQTVWVGLVGVVVAVCAVFSIPVLTADHLQRVFSEVPPEHYGPWSRALFAASDWLKLLWPVLLCFTAATLTMLVWSLQRWYGHARSFADQWGVWRLYRVVQAVRFLSLLAVLLKPRGNTGARLREALLIQQRGASPWLNHHLEKMLRRIDSGALAIEALHTGLIDRETWWYFTDMVHTLGLDEGLQRTKQRLAIHTVQRLQRQATAARWLLLLAAVAVVFLVAFWHFRVFDELRQSLSLYYAR
jgi:type II secretory pathway component PulF